MESMNVNTVRMRTKNKRIPIYDIKSSVISAELLGLKKLMFDVKELEPGQLSYPNHYHSDNEEMFLIIEGQVTLRNNGEIKILVAGDLVVFKTGEEGCHQLLNHTEDIVRYLDLSTNQDSDICYYPDSNKINSGSGNIYKIEEKVDYFEGEESLPSFWETAQSKKKYDE